eukprot:scaffold3170_cov81-Isochrysis_galbana.AAC.1
MARCAAAPLPVNVLQCAVSVLEVLLPLAVVLVPVWERVQPTAVHLAVDPLALEDTAVRVEIPGGEEEMNPPSELTDPGGGGGGCIPAPSRQPRCPLQPSAHFPNPCIFPSSQSPSYFSDVPPSAAAYVTVPFPCRRSSFQSPS